MAAKGYRIVGRSEIGQHRLFIPGGTGFFGKSVLDYRLRHPEWRVRKIAHQEWRQMDISKCARRFAKMLGEVKILSMR